MYRLSKTLFQVLSDEHLYEVGKKYGGGYCSESPNGRGRHRNTWRALIHLVHPAWHCVTPGSPQNQNDRKATCFESMQDIEATERHSWKAFQTGFRKWQKGGISVLRDILRGINGNGPFTVMTFKNSNIHNVFGLHLVLGLVLHWAKDN